MPKITVIPHAEICPTGKVFIAKKGENICSELLNNGISIEHACDMVCACTTCHVIIKSGFQSLNEINELEEDLLDRAWGLTATSRLSCQAIINDEDLTLEIPKYTINYAKEK